MTDFAALLLVDDGAPASQLLLLAPETLADWLRGASERSRALVAAHGRQPPALLRGVAQEQRKLALDALFFLSEHNRGEVAQASGVAMLTNSASSRSMRTP
jgi:hypothetical protein